MNAITDTAAPLDRALARALAERVLSLEVGAVAAETARAAKVAIIDTVGVALLGAVTDTARIARRVAAPGPGPVAATATVIGTAERAAPAEAAWLNGVAAHALDYDDFTELLGGHPSVPVLPAALAVAEARDASGAALLAAYVAGVEIESRIALGVHYHHYEKGWHPTSTLGVFGAAAAAARLLGLDVEATTRALAIAASSASGVKANFGTMTKPLHVGNCARDGVLAARLAEEGFTANPAVLESSQGFLEVYNGAGEYRIEPMLDGWFEPALVERPGISLKQFPCCGSTHPAIFAALRLREAHDVDPMSVRSVEILTHPRRLPHTDKPRPRSALEGKFSIQYCVSRALVDGRVGVAHFEGGAWEEPPIVHLLERTRAGADPEMAAREDRTFGAEVAISLADGRRLVERIEHMPGRGPDHPMTDAELYEKFEDCAARALPAAAVRPLYEALASLESHSSVRALAGLAAITGSGASAAAD